MLVPQPIRGVPNDLDRCWMSDDYLDLIVWFTTEGAIDGFQLCYDKRGTERALTWRAATGFQHHTVDSGEASPLTNCTSTLNGGGTFPAAQVRAEFRKRSRLINRNVQALVMQRVAEFGDLLDRE
jgi:hypothetical protein